MQLLTFSQYHSLSQLILAASWKYVVLFYLTIVPLDDITSLGPAVAGVAYDYSIDQFDLLLSW